MDWTVRGVLRLAVAPLTPATGTEASEADAQKDHQSRFWYGDNLRQHAYLIAGTTGF